MIETMAWVVLIGVFMLVLIAGAVIGLLYLLDYLQNVQK
jgi:hypothetical protein